MLRKNWLEGREIVKLEHPATGMALLPIDQTIVVLSNSLMCFSKKGKLLWSSNLPQDAICLTPVPLPHLGISLVSDSSFFYHNVYYHDNHIGLCRFKRWSCSNIFSKALGRSVLRTRYK